MRWDRFFADLEDQLDAEWEAERAALETEAERLRMSRLLLRDRLRALEVAPAAPIGVDLADGSTMTGTVSAVGADWFALAESSRRAATVVVPASGLVCASVPHAELLRSARAEPRGPAVADRMTIGFVLRDLARRRIPVSAGVRGGRILTGTVDRAGADHLDLALHDPGVFRHPDAVHSHRLIATDALVWVRLEGDGLRD